MLKNILIVTIVTCLTSIFINLTLAGKISVAQVNPTATPLVIINNTNQTANNSENTNQQRQLPTVSPEKLKKYEQYFQVIQKTAGMVCDSQAQALINKYGLNICNVTWEDTGRYKGSCVGPNISDMTIQVNLMDPRTKQYSLTCMPVIRYDNYSDKTADIDPSKFYLLVGNENGKDLKKITLREFLEDVPKYLSNPQSWKSEKHSLLAQRDTHVIVSSQACFLPIEKGEKAEFNPVLFNYQSYKDNPAVLTILATREGTSVTIIDNVRDGFYEGGSWGQRLFFNQKGERAGFTGQRLSDFQQSKESRGNSGHSVTANGEEGLNMVLLIQVPLKQKPVERQQSYNCGVNSVQSCSECKSDKDSNIEAAVIGHGKIEGPFTEIDNLSIERDETFPIRVTVQYYKATDNVAISEKDIKEIRKQIDKTYANADYVGSLVVEGLTERPTEYTGSKEEPANWKEIFWQRYEQYRRIYNK